MARDEHTDHDGIDAVETDLEDIAEEPDRDEADVEGFMMPTIKPLGSGILDGIRLPAVKPPASQAHQPGMRRDGVQTQSNEPLLSDDR